MKKRIIYVLILVVLILCNNMFVFATESEGVDYEEEGYGENVTDETSYPFQSFADKSIPGISVEGSVDEGIFPSGTTMSVLPVNSDVKKQIKVSTDHSFNGNQKVVDIIAIDISFSNENEKINPKNGKTVNIVVRSESLVEGKKYTVVRFKDDKSIEIIPSTETISADATVIDKEVLNNKKDISFDIKEASIYAIVEIEVVTDSTIIDNTENEVDENEISDNQYVEEVEPPDNQNEAYETEVSVDQDEENMNEASTNQNDEKDNVNSSESNETDKSGISTEEKDTEKSETSTEEKDTEKSKPSTEQKNVEESITSAEQTETKKAETPTKQNNENETKNSVGKAEKINVSIEMKWDDCDDQDGIRPENITVYLLANGKRVDVASVTEKSEWKHTYENLPKYESNETITYVAEVSNIEGYETSIDGLTIKNYHKPATVKVEGKVKWEDENNHDSLRPEYVTIKLLADGEKVDETSASEDDEWRYYFENLPKYKSAKEIKYTVEQKKVNGYKTKPNGFDVVNTHSLETVTVEGLIMWDDSSNKDGIRPESIKVKLIVDGEKTDNTATASRESNWKYSFGSFQKYKSGKEIVYTIEEVPVEGYRPEYYDHSYNITNIHEAGTVNKSTADNNSNKQPKVGDNSNIILWIIVVILSIGIVLYLIIFRRKNN